jgi:hypothetical protein
MHLPKLKKPNDWQLKWLKLIVKERATMKHDSRIGTLKQARQYNALNRNHRSGEKGGNPRIPEGHFTVHLF